LAEDISRKEVSKVTIVCLLWTGNGSVGSLKDREFVEKLSKYKHYKENTAL
jgi:hypothetical protein